MSDSDPQDLSESLDDDKIGADVVTSDDEKIDYPPDRPQGVIDPEVTAWNESVGESLADRHRREQPDVFERGSRHAVLMDEDAEEEMAEEGIVGDLEDESAEEAALHIEEG